MLGDGGLSVLGYEDPICQRLKTDVGERVVDGWLLRYLPDDPEFGHGRTLPFSRAPVRPCWVCVGCSPAQLNDRAARPQSAPLRRHQVLVRRPYPLIVRVVAQELSGVRDRRGHLVRVGCIPHLFEECLACHTRDLPAGPGRETSSGEDSFSRLASVARRSSAPRRGQGRPARRAAARGEGRRELAAREGCPSTAPSTIVPLLLPGLAPVRSPRWRCSPTSSVVTVSAGA